MRPDQHVHKVLLSSPAHFVGEFSSGDLLLTHAWPGMWESRPSQQFQTLFQPGRKRFFVLAFRTEPVDLKTVGVLPNYTPLADSVSALLCVLYGKRFDSVGILEANGFFSVPEIHFDERLAFARLGPFHDIPRQDIQIPLQLDLFAKISGLILDQSVPSDFRHPFLAAAKFYQRALEAINSDPCLSYLHLITSGEIISNLVDVPEEELYDAETIGWFETIRTKVEDGRQIVSKLKGRLRQIKRRFVWTLAYLIGDPFFAVTESAHDWGRLKKDDFEQRLQSAYDLRSHFVHSGIDFGTWVAPNGLDLEIGTPYVIQDRKLQKAVQNAPSWIGLERAIRFALLRLLQLNGFSIDDRLKHDGIRSLKQAKGQTPVLPTDDGLTTPNNE